MIWDGQPRLMRFLGCQAWFKSRMAVFQVSCRALCRTASASCLHLCLARLRLSAGLCGRHCDPSLQYQQDPTENCIQAVCVSESVPPPGPTRVVAVT